jgi:hypothetical protein
MLGFKSKFCLMFQPLLVSSMEGLKDHHQALILGVEASTKAFFFKMIGHVANVRSKRDHIALVMSDRINSLLNKVGVDSAHDPMERGVSITIYIGHSVSHGGTKVILAKH